jgi:hypothetical protein
MRVKRRAVRLDEAAEGVLIASAGSSNRRSRPSDVVEPSRLVTAEARCRCLRTTVPPKDLEMNDRLSHPGLPFSRLAVTACSIGTT